MSKKPRKVRRVAERKPEFGRETLVAVAGLTPQVITETIFALSRQSPPVLIDEVHIVTTGLGAAKVRETLLGPKGALARFIADYGAPGQQIRLDDKTIHVVKRGSIPLDDIRDVRGNQELSDLMIRLVRDLATDRDRRLHGTIAGGRKTMGFYLGYAFSLSARSWDTLSHVLVDAPYENHPDFFYPTPRPTLLRPFSGGTAADAAQACVHLAEIPFVRLRDLIPPEMAEATRFDTVVKGLQRTFDERRKATVELNLAQRELRVGNTSIRLTPEHTVIYAHYMRNKLSRCTKPKLTDCESCDACYLEIQDSGRYLSEMGRDADVARPAFRSLKHEIDHLDHRSKLSKLNRTIRKALGRANPLHEVRTLKRGYTNTRYGIAADRDRLSIVDGLEEQPKRGRR